MDEEDTANRTYAFGYSPAAVGMMQARSAEVNAAFFLGHLSTGMHLLDIGCGPGSITVGFADVVAPGDVVGVDIEPSQVQLGNEKARSLQLGNCRFEAGSVYELPFDDDTFDAVFGHTILMQFRDLDPVLAEIRRVLKPGGLVGFREVDLGANLYHYDDSAMRMVLSTLRRSIFHNDGNPDIGHSLPMILSRAGYEILSAAATYTCATTPDAKARMYKSTARLWEESDFVARAEDLGWISPEARKLLPSRLREEGDDAGSFSATSYAEVVARLEPLAT